MPARTATIADTAQVASHVIAPTVASGPIKRRRWAMSVAERLDTDRRGIDLLRRLRQRYGPAPLHLRLPGRPAALLLDSTDVHTVLAGRPEDFTPANLEKRAALRQFQPHGVLISRGTSRQRRRKINEQALDTPHTVHHDANSIVAIAQTECAALRSAVRQSRTLTWPRFNAVWWRIVRQVVFGPRAADDEELTGLLDALRQRANWAYLTPRHSRRQQRLRQRIADRVTDAPDGSLAAAVRDAGGSEANQQVPHWLFAFDAAGMTVLRTLAVLAAQPEHAARARAEAHASERPAALPFLRGCLHEAVRLWPTTPFLLRDSVQDTSLSGLDLEPGTLILIYTPFFHRGPAASGYADSFRPDIWQDATAWENAALVPFSAGPGVCPGRNVVQLVMSTTLAELIGPLHWRVDSHTGLSAVDQLPATLDHFTLRLSATPAEAP